MKLSIGTKFDRWNDNICRSCLFKNTCIRQFFSPCGLFLKYLQFYVCFNIFCFAFNRDLKVRYYMTPCDRYTVTSLAEIRKMFDNLQSGQEKWCSEIVLHDLSQFLSKSSYYCVSSREQVFEPFCFVKYWNRIHTGSRLK